MTTNLSPADYGRRLASLEPAISDEQAMEFARILLSAPTADSVRTDGAV
jgi:hypothetical protein